MRVCDRCQTKATDEIIFVKDEMHLDLCDKCNQELKEFISRPKVVDLPPEGKTRGRPRKKNSAPSRIVQ